MKTKEKTITIDSDSSFSFKRITVRHSNGYFKLETPQGGVLYFWVHLHPDVAKTIRAGDPRTRSIVEFSLSGLEQLLQSYKEIIESGRSYDEPLRF